MSLLLDVLTNLDMPQNEVVNELISAGYQKAEVTRMISRLLETKDIVMDNNHLKITASGKKLWESV